MTQTVEIDNAIQEMTDVTEPFVIPEGYVTGDEFARRVIERITIFYKEHGLI